MPSARHKCRANQTIAGYIRPAEKRLIMKIKPRNLIAENPQQGIGPLAGFYGC
jgi:hypothetical protein